jgi:hypothetical protein
MARYTRHKTLTMERAFQPRLEFQRQRQRVAVQSNTLAKGPAEQTGGSPTTPDDVLYSVVKDVDDILLKPAAELDHVRALEVALVKLEGTNKLLVRARARRDNVLEQIERYRAGLGQRLRRISDKIIATELAAVAAQPKQVVEPLVPPWRAPGMISPARAEASRSNGRKSRGPRTAAGKSCASRNALRHGLAALTYKPGLFPEIERIAKAICNGDTNPLLFEQALVIAENEMVLRCVSVERIAAIERLRDITAKPLSKRDNSVTRAKARFRQAKLRYRQLVQAKANNVAANNRQGRNSLQVQESEPVQSQPTRKQKPIKLRDEFDALRLAMPDLDRLARYERRAWSRRKRAVCEFIEIKSRSES